MDFGEADSFFAAWPEAEPEPALKTAEVWRMFFDTFGGLEAKAAPALPRAEIGADDFTRFADAFTQRLADVRRRGDDVDLWRFANLGEDELKNCAVLGWLLDERGDHGLGAALLKDVVNMTGGAVTSERIAAHSYSTRVEALPLGFSDNRIDIEIDSSGFLIIIEAKIMAAEGDGQLRRYCELAKLKAAGQPWTVIFLTRDGRRPADASLHQSVATLSWRQLAGLLRSQAKVAPSAVIKQLLLQFAFHLSNFNK